MYDFIDIDKSNKPIIILNLKFSNDKTQNEIQLEFKNIEDKILKMYNNLKKIYLLIDTTKCSSIPNYSYATKIVNIFKKYKLYEKDQIKYSVIIINNFLFKFILKFILKIYNPTTKFKIFLTKNEGLQFLKKKLINS